MTFLIVSSDALFTSCYLYRNDVSDLTFTYNFNVARIAAHARLIQDISIDLQSNAYPNFDATANFSEKFEKLAVTDGCNMIVLTSSRFLGLVRMFAPIYPNITFIYRVSDSLPTIFPTNSAFYTVSIHQGLFRAGAVASHYVDDGGCVGFIANRFTRSWEADAFFRGMEWANRTGAVSLLLVLLGEDGSAANELNAADLLLTQQGCTVVITTTLNNVLPEFVGSMSSSAVSIGYGADAALTAGDSVLTSVYAGLEGFFYNITRDAILNTLPWSYEVNQSSEVILAELSPRSSVSLVSIADEAKTYADAHDCSCGNFTDQDGVHRQLCVNISNRDNFPYLNNNIHFKAAYRPPTVCNPGTYASYDGTTFALSCIVCGPNTFAPIAGSKACIPCETGLVSAPGSSSCGAPQQSSFEALLVIPIVVGAIAGLLVCGAATVSMFRVRVAPSLDPRNAPSGPEVALAMIGVDGTRSERQWRHSLTNMCDVYDQLAAIISSVANIHKGYIFLSVGDVFMIAMDDTFDLVQLLGHVQERAAGASWPCSIRLKMAVHFGTPEIGESQSRKVPGGDDDRRKTYSGTDVEILRLLWKRELSEPHDLVVSDLARARLEARGTNETGCMMMFELSEPVPLHMEDKRRTVAASDLRFLPRATPPLHSSDLTGGESDHMNPLSIALPPLGDLGGSGDPDSRSGVSPSESSDNVDDDLSRLVTPSAISKEELDALRSLGVDLLQKFIRVFNFDDQVSIVTAIAKKLHVQAPQIPEMKTSAKKSFNVLRNSLRQICSQLLLSMDEVELHAWLDAVAAQMNEVEEHAEEDTQAAQAPAPT